MKTWVARKLVTIYLKKRHFRKGKKYGESTENEKKEALLLLLLLVQFTIQTIQFYY